MLYTLYLIGYGNEVPEKFLERLAYAGDQVLVLDVRSRRASWAWSYTGPQVEYVFKNAGHDYIWLPGLGGNGHNDVTYRFGLRCLEAKVREGPVPVVLMCAELRSRECHRLRLAQALRKRLELAGDELEIRPL